MKNGLEMEHRSNMGTVVALIIFLGAFLKTPLVCSEEASPTTSPEAVQGQLEADNPDRYYRNGDPVDTGHQLQLFLDPSS